MGNIDPKLSEPLVHPLSKCCSDCSKYCLDECSCEFSCGCCKWSITTHHTTASEKTDQEEFESINDEEDQVL